MILLIFKVSECSPELRSPQEEGLQVGNKRAFGKGGLAPVGLPPKSAFSFWTYS
jgi:hypothetical protein